MDIFTLKNNSKLNDIANQLDTNISAIANKADSTRVDNIIAQSGSSSTEVTDSRVSTSKNRTFTVLTNRLNELENETINNRTSIKKVMLGGKTLSVINSATNLITYPDNADENTPIDFTISGKTIRNGDNIISKVSLNSITTKNPDSSSNIIHSFDTTLDLNGCASTVADTVDSNGTVTKQINSKVLNGTEAWSNTLMTSTDTLQFEATISDMATIVNTVMSDLFPSVDKDTMYANTYNLEGVANNSGKLVRIRILKSKLSTQDVNGFKTWLASNQVTIFYQASQSIISKVPISLLRPYKNGSLITDSIIAPSISCSVPLSDYSDLSGLIKVTPPKIYTVCNDLQADGYGKNYSAPIYLDHLIDVSGKKMNFRNAKDKVAFASDSKINDSSPYSPIFNNGNMVDVQTKTVYVDSGNKNTSFNVQQISTNASVGSTITPKVLVIGDSLTAGVGADSTNTGNVLNGKVYWAYLKQLFEQDKITNGNDESKYNIKLLGKSQSRSYDLTFKNITKTLKSGAEGLSGWALFDFLRHANNIGIGQTSWDALGLGNGTHTDYTGSFAQAQLIAQTCETYSGTTPLNPFFDNSKSGTNRFSIAKWISRYRTCDDNGVKLTLGSGTGSLVTLQSQIDNTDVCTPTHIIIQLGINDVAQCTVDQFISDVQEVISSIHAELPNCYIGISITPDNAGTFFPELYPEVLNCTLSSHTNRVTTAQRLISALGSNEVINKAYLIPSYFVQPTAYAYPLREASLPENDFGLWAKKEDKVLIPFGYTGVTHVSSYAHMNWAYQMYAWLKYTLTL